MAPQSDQIDVTNDRCILKYELIQGHIARGRFTNLDRLAEISDQTASYEAFFSNGLAPIAHAMFIAENGSVGNFGIIATLRGRPRQVDNALDASFIAHDIVDFEVIHDLTPLPTNVVMRPTFQTQIPVSHHVTVEQMTSMYANGWNRSVLPEYEFHLGPDKFKLPQMPPIERWSHFCTCQNTKSELLVCKSTTSNQTLTQHFTESCPMNLIHC